MIHSINRKQNRPTEFAHFMNREEIESNKIER